MSEKSVVQKLLLKPGQKMLLLNAPEGYRGSLALLPEGARLEVKLVHADVIQIFVTAMEELKKKLDAVKPILTEKTVLWISYPKGTSKIATDLDRDIIREYADGVGLTGVSIFSIDEDWSALRLRLKE
jgi:hypothetical protein